MKLFALSDLHVGHRPNREALEALPAQPDDWLILAGDLGERLEHLQWVLATLTPRWAQLLWVPGNHELWTMANDKIQLRGVARYQALVGLCRRHGCLTPEDPWASWPGQGPPRTLALLFTLYDYSLAPPELDPAGAVAWAAEDRIVAADESWLHPDPYPSRAAWCAARIAESESRLAAIPDHHRAVLVNHWPLRRDLIRLFRIPRYIPWCGSAATHDWHRRFRAEVVVSGHLHMRATDWRDGTRFEEVSLGYPRHWDPNKGAAHYLRQILPGPTEAPASGTGGPLWRR